MPQISVIVPVYQVEPYLRRCVDSLLSQTFSDFKLILVDDGSFDGSPAICDAYARQDARVVVIHQANGGLSAARNAGLDWVFAHSDSQWLGFVDSDDWVHPQYLETLHSGAVNCGVPVSICGFYRTRGEEPDISREDMTPVLWPSEELYVSHNVNATVAWGKLYARRCFDTLRYPVGKLHEDEFTTYQILLPQPHCAYVSAPLYCYFQNPKGIMASPWRPEKLDVLDAYRQRIEFFRQNGNGRMVQWAWEKYIWSMIAIREKLGEPGNENLGRSYRKILCRRLRWELLRNAKSLPVSGFAGAYELAFPRGMKLYWYAAAGKRKIRNRISRGREWWRDIWAQKSV